MAEFQDVMKQAKRMCSSYGDRCTGCDFDGVGKRCVFRVAPVGWENEDFESIEEKVMNWAAAHPEPKYPTWLEYLIEIGVIKTDKKIETASDALRRTCDIVVGTRDTMISADIAKKLGIKPIGGAE